MTGPSDAPAAASNRPLISGGRPLLVVDVDEVLALFAKGFGAFLADRGHELRLDRFALFQNIYPAGAAEPVDLAVGRALFAEFFRGHSGELEPVPGAIAALERIGRRAEVVVFSNAPPEAEALRQAWLRRHGLAHPLILGTGPKGPTTAALAALTPYPAAFVDDLLSNLDSVAEHAPAVATFQHVADPRLQPLAPAAPDRHPRIDDWAELADAIEAALHGR